MFTIVRGPWGDVKPLRRALVHYAGLCRTRFLRGATRRITLPEKHEMFLFPPTLIRIVAGTTLLATIGGCAVVPSKSNPDYSLIDTYGVNMAVYERDYQDCARLANQSDMATHALAGALAGALLGAAIGPSYRVSNNYAMRSGASVGLSAGAAHGMREARYAMRACLQNRGYAVIR